MHPLLWVLIGYVIGFVITLCAAIKYDKIIDDVEETDDYIVISCVWPIFIWIILYFYLRLFINNVMIGPNTKRKKK